MPSCRHQNIHWEDFFKKEKKNKAYCLDCGDDKSLVFSKALQRWYCDKIEEWLKDNGITEEFGGHHSTYKFTEFLKKENYYENWNKLQLGRINDNKDFDNIFGQMIFFEAAKSIEYLCYEFKKEKQNNPTNRERERERERAKN